MRNKRKKTTAVIAAVMAVILLLGGTFAWQSINQTALNEASDVINPGGRLHDDFDGSNKDVYVENFADEDIFARIQLSEYFAIIANYGVEGAETRNEIAGTLDEDGNYTYDIHYFDDTNTTDEYWTWATGGSTVYMPTFNLNKDSLVADINGTYVDDVGGISNRDGSQYTDYTDYTEVNAETDTEIYDADTNMDDEVGTDFENLDTYVESDNIVTIPGQEHTAKETGYGELISMAEWLTMIEDNGGVYDQELHGYYWVYDTDGWVYWSAPIAPDTATGLLLDGIELNGVMDDTWYYAINVVAQFVTADDVGNTDGTGFYSEADGTVPTGDAETLLGYIGVQMDGENAGDEGDEGDEYQVLELDAENTNTVFAAIDEGIRITTYDADADIDDVMVYYYESNEENEAVEVYLDESQYTYDGEILTITDYGLETDTSVLTVTDANRAVFGSIEIDYSHNVENADYISIGYVPGGQPGTENLTNTVYTTDGYMKPSDYLTLTASAVIGGEVDEDVIVSDEDVWTVEGATSADTKVDENGKLTIGADESTKLHLITVKVAYRGLEATESIYVSGGLVATITEVNSAETYVKGEKYQFSVSVLENGEDVTNSFNNWNWGAYDANNYSDANVEIDDNGNLTVKEAGEYYISASADNYFGPSLRITVE